MDNTPPVPQVPKSFSAKAGKWSLFAFGAAMILNWTNSTMKSSGIQNSPRVNLIVFYVSMLLFGLGFICGIIAMTGINRAGKKDSATRGIAGVLLNGFMLFIAITNFSAGRNRAQQNYERFHQTDLEARQDLKNSFDETNGIKPKLAMAEKIQHALQEGAKNSSGDEHLLFEAYATYMKKIQAAAKEYGGFQQELTDADVLELGNLDKIEKLQERRKVVQRFLQANDKFKKIVSNLKNLMRDELVNVKLSEKEIQKALTGYDSTARVRNTLLLQMRESTNNYGKAILKILNLLEKHWDDWEYKDDKLTSSNDGFLEQYNKASEEYNNILKEQIMLQKKFANLK